MLPTPDDRITTGKQFAQVATELQDTEVQAAMKMIVSVQQRYAHKRNTKENLESLRDEVLTRFMEMGILATFDPTPCFYGEPPTLEIIGKVAGDAIHHHGFDHEKKQYEVRKANTRGEDFLGQKESPDARRDKKS